ncbi:NADH-quinone oxidoreductase subunit NuoI [Desulfolithobacter sp.]
MRVQYDLKKSFFETIFLTELARGMMLTLKRLFSRPITRQYPDESPPIALGFRGQHALVRDPQTGGSRCVACMRCATVCPSRCIHIRFHEEDGRRVVDRYDIDALRCVYCGYCEEVCPVNALVLTEVFDYCEYDKESLYFTREDLLANWDSFLKSSGHRGETYVNPFWRPRGLPESMLPAGKRLKVPDSWTVDGQVVGTRYRRS